MPKVYVAPLPAGALLEKYAQRPELYTDCFATAIAQPVNFEAFVAAFYTTWLFKLERVILALALGLGSSDAQASELARGERETFAAWRVEARTSNQLLLDAGSTRSWLMLSLERSESATRQMLYFGSAVVATRGGRLTWPYRALLGFHKLYSRLLLAAARRRLAN